MCNYKNYILTKVTSNQTSPLGSSTSLEVITVLSTYLFALALTPCTTSLLPLSPAWVPAYLAQVLTPHPPSLSPGWVAISFPQMEIKLSPVALTYILRDQHCQRQNLSFPIVPAMFQGWHWLAQLRSHNYSSTTVVAEGRGLRGSMLTIELSWSLWEYMGWEWHANLFSEGKPGARTRRRKTGNRVGKKTLQVPNRVRKQRGVEIPNKKFGSKKERDKVCKAVIFKKGKLNIFTGRQEATHKVCHFWELWKCIQIKGLHS